MGVLDELKREADAVKAQQEEQKLSAEAVRELAIKTVQPRVQKLFKYFKELKTQLDVRRMQAFLPREPAIEIGKSHESVRGDRVID